MTVSKRTRFEVLKRDDHTCRYCRSTEGALTVDHVVPVALGGSDAPDNLVAACRDCNAGKSSSSPDGSLVAQVADDAVRWREAMRLAAEEMAGSAADDAAYADAFLAAWTRGWLPDNWEATMLSLRRAGLPVSEIQYAAKVAGSAYSIDNRFKYFCGVAWKRLQAIQEKAKELLAEQAERSGGAECKYCRATVEIDPNDYENGEDYRQAHVDVHCSTCDFVFFEGAEYGFHQARAKYEVAP